MKKYDVVVVGAGPAGSIAARDLARGGASVLVIEKRQEIGSPKRCAEGVNAYGLEQVDVKPDPHWAVNEISGATVYSPSGKIVEMNDQHKGYVLERKVFEKFLARDAVNAGAEYMIKTEGISVLKEDGKVMGIKASCMGEEFEIKAKIVIAADGRESKIAQSAGLNTINRINDYESGFQYEMAGLKNIRWDHIHLFFGNEVAPGGYLWIFPKYDGIANVGIGIIASKKKKRAKEYLDAFIKKHGEIFGGAYPIEMNAGGVSVSKSADKFVASGLMAIGDAAQLVNPIHGGGIILAMRSGALAAKIALSALKEGDFSEKKLREYESTWREKEDIKREKLYKLRMFASNLSDDDFEMLSDMLSGENLSEMSHGKYMFLFKLFVKHPRMLMMARKFL